jgi:hypothetical protein
MGTKNAEGRTNNFKKLSIVMIPDFSGIFVVCFVKLHAFTFLVPYYDVHYDFCARTMLNSSLCPFFYYKMDAWQIRAPMVLIQT